MIEIEGVSKRYGEQTVVDDVSLTIASGTLTTILGSSGAGKSTLLRMINRLVEPDQGTIRIDGQPVTAVPEDELRRRIGYVIQGHGLFPHRTVEANIATVPRLLGWEATRTRQRVAELLALFGLDPARYAPRFPHELSGGEQQRVGLARAFAAEPRLLLMDEPFGALDPRTRAKARADLRAIQARFRTTIVMVTHDVDEAFELADRVAVMAHGRLLQLAPPAELLLHPAQAGVTELIGTNDRPLRLLATMAVADAIELGAAPGPPLDPRTSLRDALSGLVWAGRDAAPVAGEGTVPRGRVTVAAMLARARPS